MLALFRLAAVVYLRLLPSTIRARMVERANDGFTGPAAASIYQALLKFAGVGAWDGNEASGGSSAALTAFIGENTTETNDAILEQLTERIAVEGTAFYQSFDFTVESVNQNGFISTNNTVDYETWRLGSAEFGPDSSDSAAARMMFIAGTGADPQGVNIANAQAAISNLNSVFDGIFGGTASTVAATDGYATFAGANGYPVNVVDAPTVAILEFLAELVVSP